MAKLNETNEHTRKIMHLMITDKCDRKCPLCCNNQYDINDIPVASNEDFKNAETLYLTGGEPFAYEDPCFIARIAKDMFPNIKKVRVYTNAFELWVFLITNEKFKIHDIDGLTISIKTKHDLTAFRDYLTKRPDIINLESNWVYVFHPFEDMEVPEGFHKEIREWQEDFIPEPNSIFRKLGFFK